MQLRLETFRKSDPSQPSVELGLTLLEFAEPEIRLLEELERQLQQSSEDALLHDISPEVINLEPPASCGELKQCQLRLVHEGDLDATHVHLVARQASDDSLIYTNTVMVRMLTA